MRLSGVQKLTHIDYPGKLAAIAFTPGCTLRCRYCYNPEFVLPDAIQRLTSSFIPESIFFRFLDSRRGLLDGVVICGGEPTIHRDLPEFLEKIRARGFLIKLDTNGGNPDMLEYLLRK